MRRALAIAGAVAGLAGAGAGTAAAWNRRRRQRFYDDVLGDLAQALAFYRARLTAAANNEVAPALALTFLSNLPGFTVTREDLIADVSVSLPPNRDVSKLTVVINGPGKALQALRDRLTTSERLCAEDISDVEATTGGSELRLTLLALSERDNDVRTVQQKLQQLD